LVSLDLSINNVSNLILTTNGNTISSNNSFANYQWLNCNTNFSIIDGETGISLTTQNAGYYALELNENNCLDTTLCYEINPVGIIDNEFETKLIVYPNPTSGNFTIDFGKTNTDALIKIEDVNGKLIDLIKHVESKLIHLKIEQAAGVYFISIESDDEKAIIKIIKD
jgi:hypothetical protein